MWCLLRGLPAPSSACELHCPVYAHIAMEVTTDAVQIGGGTAYMKDEPVEKYMRGAKVFQIWEGTSQVQRFVISRDEIGEL